MPENAIADTDSTSDDGSSVVRSREEALAAAKAFLDHLPGEDDDVRELLTGLIDELSKRSSSPQSSESTSRLAEIDETCELPRPNIAVDDELEQTQDSSPPHGPAIEVTEESTRPNETDANADNSAPVSPHDDDELGDAIAVRKILQDRQEMLKFLDGLFSTFPEYASLRKKLGVKVGRETPLRLFEECVVQASRFSSTEQQFAQPYAKRIDCLKRYSICALQPGRESALIVQKPLSIDDGLHAFDDGLAVETGTPLYLLEELGKGGFGSVYRAMIRQRQFAIKVSNASADNVKIIRRYLREARSLSIANSLPGFIRIHNAGTLHNGSFFLQLEYVDGVDLARLIHYSDVDQQIHQQSAVVLMYNAAVSLAHLHAREVFHRDIKPANIMVDRITGEVRIADLGLAVIEDSHTITETGGIAGTLDYLPPEACHGSTTYPADVFALGATMYAIFTGRKLFSFGSDGRAWLQAMSRYQPPKVDAVPNRLIQQLIGEMICREPSQRITMSGVAERLAGLMTSPKLFGDKQCQYYRKSLSSTARSEAQDSTDFSIDSQSGFDQHISLDSASLGYVTGVINSIVAKQTGEAVPTKLLATASQSASVPEDNHSHRDKVTEQIIGGVFSRLENGQRLGRSWPQRATATIIANQIAVGVGLVVLLLIAGFAQYRHVRNQRVAQVQSRIADLRSLMGQSTPPQKSQLDAAVQQFNASLEAIGESQRAEFVDAVRQGDVLEEFTINQSSAGIASIKIDADIKFAELALIAKEVLAVLDGSAQSIDVVVGLPQFTELQNAVNVMLKLDYSPSKSEVTALVHSCIPSPVQAEYTCTLADSALHMNHKAELKAVAEVTKQFTEINTSLATADGPHVEAVRMLLKKLNSQITAWPHRMAVRDSVVNRGMKSLPEYIAVNNNESGIALTNKVELDEEGNKTIHWRFGNIILDNKSNISSIFITEDSEFIPFNREYNFTNSVGDHINFSIIWQKQMNKLKTSIMMDGKLLDSIKYRSFDIKVSSKNISLLVITGLSGFVSIDHLNNSIKRFSTIDDLNIDTLLAMKDIQHFNLEEWNSDTLGKKAIEFKSDIDKLIIYLGAYPLLKDTNIDTKFDYVDYLLNKKTKISTTQPPPQSPQP